MSIIDATPDQAVDTDIAVNIIFLDIDGVLNSHPFFKFCYDQGILPDDKIDPKAVLLLNELARKTNSKIVVSSTWRLPYVDHNDLDGLKKLLSTKHGVDDVIIGMTPDLWKVKRNRIRGDEIQDWMDNCGLKINSFVILDDDSDMGPLRKFLVKTSMQTGLQRSHILDAMQILKGM